MHRTLLMASGWVLVATVSLSASGCGHSELRGSVARSEDGRTYLVVADDNGGECGPIKVDGQVWPHPLDERGAVEPGTHQIECGTAVEIDVPEGTVFRFDYWGP